LDSVTGLQLHSGTGIALEKTDNKVVERAIKARCVFVTCPFNSPLAESSLQILNNAPEAVQNDGNITRAKLILSEVLVI